MSRESNEELLIKIRNQISAYQSNITSDNKANRYDINNRAEIFTIPLFKVIFGWEDLFDLNAKTKNYPGLDLGDRIKRVAVQVTSETRVDKVKSTLTTCVEKEYYRDFDRIVIFMIQAKQKSYSEKSLKQICSGKISFRAERDIIDLTDLLGEIKRLERSQLVKVLDLFADETGYATSIDVSHLKVNIESFDAPQGPPFETGYMNLFKIEFPKLIYIADWDFSKRDLGIRARDERKVVRAALEAKKLRFASDWTSFEKKVVTFHDLNDDSKPLAQVVDLGTVTELSSNEYYSDPYYRNTFAELLQKCLQQKLFHLGITWQHKEREFIFVPEHSEDEVRQITWQGQKQDTRTVYKQIPDLKDESRVFCHEHFAFKARFYSFNEEWFLSLTPDWFYSSDGYERAWYIIEEKRKYKKLVETNSHVATHIRFLHSYITTNDPGKEQQLNLFPDIHRPPKPYDFLLIGDQLVIDKLPPLPDQAWKPLDLPVVDDRDLLL